MVRLDFAVHGVLLYWMFDAFTHIGSLIPMHCLCLFFFVCVLYPLDCIAWHWLTAISQAYKSLCVVDVDVHSPGAYSIEMPNKNVKTEWRGEKNNKMSPFTIKQMGRMNERANATDKLKKHQMMRKKIISAYYHALVSALPIDYISDTHFSKTSFPFPVPDYRHQFPRCIFALESFFVCACVR